MAVTIDVDYTVLDTAKAAWDAQADTLDAATRRVGKVSGHGLAPAVAAEVDAFAAKWHVEIRALAGVAQANADAFTYARGTYRISDLEQAEKIRSLLPWGQRNDPIRRA